MSDFNEDQYEHFNYDFDKHIFTGHGGKQRSKREQSQHTNSFDPNGHSRKLAAKFMNAEQNKKHLFKGKA
uniref:Nuclear protein 1 n=1 Tax=Bracon brevicornis TaxID=1563983 RepID=A0A6V7J4B7_9HYME